MEPSLLFFLTIDRCFLLNYPVDYSKSKQKILLIAAIIIGILSGVSNEIVFILDLPDKSETSKIFCENSELAQLMGFSTISSQSGKGMMGESYIAQ